MILNKGKLLLCFERLQESFGNVLPVFDTTEQTVLVQAVYVKWVSWESLYVFYTLCSCFMVLENQVQTMA